MSTPLQMHAKRYPSLIHLLALAVLFSAVAPCVLIEVAAEPCTASLSTSRSAAHDAADRPALHEATDASETSGEAEPMPVDCCAGCLTCCASYTPTPATGSLAVLVSATQTGFFAVPGPRESPYSIWRPPRRWAPPFFHLTRLPTRASVC